MPDIDKEPPIYGESMLHGAYQAWHIKKNDRQEDLKMKLFIVVFAKVATKQIEELGPGSISFFKTFIEAQGVDDAYTKGHRKAKEEDPAYFDLEEGSLINDWVIPVFSDENNQQRNEFICYAAAQVHSINGFDSIYRITKAKDLADNLEALGLDYWRTKETVLK